MNPFLILEVNQGGGNHPFFRADQGQAISLPLLFHMKLAVQKYDNLDIIYLVNCQIVK
jgi:hypothetical protein